MQLKLKESIYILKESSDIYQVIFTGTRRIKKFRVDNLVKEVIDSLKVAKEENVIINEFKSKYPIDHIITCLNSLQSQGIIRKDNKMADKRFSKQILFIDELTKSREESLRLQNKIQNSTVTILGVGGIGTWIVNGLYQIGIGKIKITDPDIVEESNLNRQLFFDSRDIGEYKVDVIKRKLNDANIVAFKKTVSDSENLEELVKDSNFLINCADNPSVAETSRIIDQYAKRFNIAYCVAGGYNMHLGMIGPIIIPGKTATFNDFLEFQKNADPLKDFEKIKDIEDTGNLGPIAGAVANIQVIEIFKYLIGKGELNLNRFAEIDFLNFNVKWRNFKK